MQRTSIVPTLIASLLAVVALAGCFGGESGDGSEASPTTSGTGDDSGSPFPTNDTGSGPGGPVSVTILNYTESANVSEPIAVEWSVETDGNETALEVTNTMIAYGNESHMSPEGPDDYGNTSGESAGTTPQNFSTEFSVDEPTTIYFRAYALVDGADYWSTEQTVEVGGIAGEAVNITIQAASVGYLSGYDPDEVTINVGDAVSWFNEDDSTHTATATDGSWTTGDVSEGQASEAIVFEEPGEYEYQCDYHPQTMSGTITVVE